MFGEIESSGRYNCTVDGCKRSYSSKGGLSTHLKKHFGKFSFICSIEDCGKSFLSSYNLKIHMRVHNNIRPFACNVCAKTFTTIYRLNSHKRIHNGTTFKCPESGCIKAFITLCDLRKHQRIHTGEKPYNCSQCNKSFALKHQLDIHTRTHTGVRPYRCVVCSARYYSRSALTTHVKRVHCLRQTLLDHAVSHSSSLSQTTRDPGLARNISSSDTAQLSTEFCDQQIPTTIHPHQVQTEACMEPLITRMNETGMCNMGDRDLLSPDGELLDNQCTSLDACDVSSDVSVQVYYADSTSDLSCATPTSKMSEPDPFQYLIGITSSPHAQSSGCFDSLFTESDQLDLKYESPISPILHHEIPQYCPPESDMNSSRPCLDLQPNSTLSNSPNSALKFDAEETQANSDNLSNSCYCRQGPVNVDRQKSDKQQSRAGSSRAPCCVTLCLSKLSILHDYIGSMFPATSQRCGGVREFLRVLHTLTSCKSAGTSRYDTCARDEFVNSSLHCECCQFVPQAADVLRLLG